MRSVLFMATYPINNPMHGGQIRSNAIFNELLNNKFRCAFFSIFDQNGYPDFVSDDVYWSNPTTDKQLMSLSERNLRSDIGSSMIVLENKELYLKFKEKFIKFKPDLVILEQPWLWPLLKAILAETALEVLIIYSSQNIEQKLAFDLSKNRGDDDPFFVCKSVKEIEDELALVAAGIICVSSHDARYFSQYNKNILVAPNGVWPVSESRESVYWKNRLQNLNFSLFVGSAHLPNAQGFVEMLSPDVSFLQPNERIIVAGGVKNLLVETDFFNRYSKFNFSRIELLGEIDTNSLASLVSLARCIILPITSGGGTNLKTAEAMYSRKGIVATTMAFRGFEQFIEYQNVKIADNSADFRNSIVYFLRNPVIHYFSMQQNASLESLNWRSALSNVPVFVRSVASYFHREKSVIFSVDFKPLAGWYQYEVDSGMLWASSKIAVLHSKVLSLNGAIKFTCKIRAYRKNRPKVLVEVFSARGFLCSADVGNGFVDIEFFLNEADVFENILEIYFKTSELTSPSLDGGSDSRFLGVGIKDIFCISTNEECYFFNCGV